MGWLGSRPARPHEIARALRPGPLTVDGKSGICRSRSAALQQLHLRARSPAFHRKILLNMQIDRHLIAGVLPQNRSSELQYRHVAPHEYPLL